MQQRSRWVQTHAASIYNMLNYTATLQPGSGKQHNTVGLQHNYLMNAAQLCMQSVHRHADHYVHAEGWVPYGASARRMLHLHARPCSCMHYEVRNLNGAAAFLFFFFLPLCESAPLTSSSSFAPFSPPRLFPSSPLQTADRDVSHPWSATPLENMPLGPSALLHG